MHRAWGRSRGGYIIAKEAAWLAVAVTFLAGLMWGFFIGLLVGFWS